ncbi:MAG: hypothetical protein JO354_00800 [Verrucomicrobia bacterium]|nr:hypothetical protein [Verrucomicrobiota bacterium]
MPKKAVPGDYDRTWLSDDYFDLIVWHLPSGVIHGFQLCYGKPRWERALTWRSGRGFSHMQVDDGEHSAWGNATPILIPDGAFPAETVVAEFQRRALDLPVELRQLVLKKIEEYVRTRKA